MKNNNLSSMLLLLTLFLSFFTFLSPIPLAKADSDTWQTNSSYDDDYFDVSTSTYNPAEDYTLTTTYTSASLKKHSAYHFDSVGIPQGSNVTYARIEVYVYSTNDDPVFNVYGHDVDDSSELSEGWVSRVKTGNSTDVSEGNVGTGWYEIVITDVVKEIIDREGWNSGNDLTIIFWAKTTSMYGFRCYTWDYDVGNKGAKLYVEWDPPPDPPTYDSLDAEKDHVYYDDYIFLNSTVSIPLGHVSGLVNVTIGLQDSIILKYDNDTDTFSEYSDPSSYIVLNASACERTSLNSTQVMLSFNVLFNNSCPAEYKDASASTTKIFQDDGQYGSRSFIDWFFLWGAGGVLATDDTGFTYGWSNITGDTWINESSQSEINLNIKYDNSTLTTRSLSDFGSTVTNYATLYVVDYGFVWGWSSTIYDVYRNQSYECIGEAGYQDWLYNGLFPPPTFSESYPSDVMPWYVPIIGYLAAVLLPFMIIAYYWNKARDWKTGLMVLFVCIMCYILFLTLWNLSDALMYWMYR